MRGNARPFADARPTQLLRARSAAYALLARCLGPDVTALEDWTTRYTLETALRNARERPALDEVVAFDRASLPDHADLAARWIRWFDLGRVAPYEGSNRDVGAGGITPHLADVAGFYAAFASRVERDRPDHVVAQLEFLALSLMAEAEALERSDGDTAEVAAGATRTFLRDHVGRWLDVWAERVAAIEVLSPWAPYASGAAALVRSEASHRNVLIVHSPGHPRLGTGDADGEGGELECGGDPTWS